MRKQRSAKKQSTWQQFLAALARSFVGLNRVIKDTRGSYSASSLPEIPDLIEQQAGGSRAASRTRRRKKHRR